MKIIDLEPGDPRLENDLLPVLLELRPHLTPELFREVYEAGHPQGLRFSAAYADDGRCVGAVELADHQHHQLPAQALHRRPGDRRRHPLHRGRPRARRAPGRPRTRPCGCHELDLDSGTHRTGAHRFYLRERFDIVAFHFARPLTAPEDAS